MKKKWPTRKEIQDFYDGFLTYHQQSEGNFRQQAVITFVSQNLEREDLLLDVGCGSGFITSQLAERVKEAHGIDISPKQVEYAKDKWPQASFSVLDVRDLFEPYRGYFSVILLIDLLEHVVPDDRKKVASAVSSYLGQNGRLFIEVPDYSVLKRLRDQDDPRLQIVDEPVSESELAELFPYKLGDRRFILGATGQPEYWLYRIDKS